MSLINQSKPTTSLTNTSKVSSSISDLSKVFNYTWDDTRVSWDDNSFTWDYCVSNITNQLKPS